MKPAVAAPLWQDSQVRRGVRAEQREPVLVRPDRLHRHPPALRRVTALARAAELPPVDVRVAVGAARAGVLEDQAGVAQPACHALVRPAQGKPRLTVVVELQDAAQRAPTRRGVAVGARRRQTPVRAPRGSTLVLLCRRRKHGAQDQKEHCGWEAVHGSTRRPPVRGSPRTPSASACTPLRSFH